MIKRKNILKIAIDSPAAAGAGTLAKAISKQYNLFYLDTGKIYRMIAYIKMKFPKQFNQAFLKKKIRSIKTKDLTNKNLLTDEVGTEASIISKNKNLRKLVHSFQVNCAYNPPKKYNGSCLDGRDITYNIVPDADIKLYLTATLKVRALRRYKELKKLNHKISFKEVYKTIKKRDKNDRTRKIAPLKKIKGAILIDTSNLTIKECFNKISNIIDRKIKKQNHT